MKFLFRVYKSEMCTKIPSNKSPFRVNESLQKLTTKYLHKINSSIFFRGDSGIVYLDGVIPPTSRSNLSSSPARPEATYTAASDSGCEPTRRHSPGIPSPSRIPGSGQGSGKPILTRTQSNGKMIQSKQQLLHTIREQDDEPSELSSTSSR